ncbi:MAG TPA: hypothetical protein VMS43_09370 [Allosphingosinicella sp.]|nr:hypothetical protein [Allosphingosinicella sp.]
MSGRANGIIFLAAAMLFMQGCTIQNGATRTRGLGAWPPSSAQCTRNNPVPFAVMNVSISAELNRLFADPACVAQPTCAGWVARENHQLSGPVSGQFWMGGTNHQFSLAEQDAIGGDARALAVAQTPSGKRLYRLTFDQAVITGGSTGVVQATAYYGQCISDITEPSRPETQR